MPDDEPRVRDVLRRHLMRLMAIEMDLLRQAEAGGNQALATVHEHGLMLLADLYSYTSRCGRE